MGKGEQKEQMVKTLGQNETTLSSGFLFSSLPKSVLE